MVNYILELRKALFRWHFLWALFAAGCGGVVIGFAMEKRDKFPLLAFLPLGLGVHFTVGVVIVYWRGRWWGEHCYDFALEWWGMTILQGLGFVGSVGISVLASFFEFNPYEALACCGYSLCMSQFLQFLVRLDITSAFISATAYLTIIKKDPKPEGYVRDAIIVSFVLAGIVILRNFLDDLVPDQQLEERAKESQICTYDPAPQRHGPFRHRGPPSARPAAQVNNGGA